MIQIKEIINSIFTSKTYILYKSGERKVWLIDIGDVEPIKAFCSNYDYIVEGVFLTHTHFDHIYGLISLLQLFPGCLVYTNQYGRMALASEKLNLSRYHETPFSYSGENVALVQDGNEIKIFEGEATLRVFETPGHNPSCLTMVLGDLIFTGDAYIPGICVNTQLPNADKVKAKESMKRILRLANGKKILSGHLV